MEFTYEASFGTQGLEPYERLLYDAMLGDGTQMHELITPRRRCSCGIRAAKPRHAAGFPL